MKFLFSFIILFVLIITNKFFLFNEEFLILISFISFCFVIYEQLGSMLNLRFEEKVLIIKNSLLTSINLISNKLAEQKQLNNKLVYLETNFNLLKKYYLQFSTSFMTQFVIYLSVKEKINFLNKLVYLNQLEKAYFKLIVLLLLKKISTINLLLNFYASDLQIKRFKTLNLINNLSLIKKI
uniref:ATP synthase F1 subunit 4 n=1 Tax=Rhodomelopsis africana TaxID=1917047 RepID=UPI0022FD413C|nr:ATP synthase F1 subunit 4 [Rhodomelopsis africana]WAX04069.1 ATP synthase F1 subunit 4 [Rhodomelopsis africana]